MICPHCGGDTATPPALTLAAPSWAEARWGTVEALAHLFNELTPQNVPAVEVISPQRRTKGRKALRIFQDRRQWERVFEEWRRSPFLSGRVPPSNGHARWVPTFDWLLANGKTGVENYVALHDGSYSNG